MKKNVKLVLCEVNNNFNEQYYEVRKLVNTVEYSIGEHIDVSVVQDIIDNYKDHTVEIVAS
jgi:hypothetical protein